MKRVPIVLTALLAAVVSLSAGQGAIPANVIADVRAAIAAKNLPTADGMVARYRSVRGVTPELIEAVSWLARGALAAQQLDRANQYALEAQNLAVRALDTIELDRNLHLQTALGAAIETQALVRVARGARSDAIYFLQRELETYRDTAIHKRIQKNINLLTLEGRPAPPLDTREFLGRPAPSATELKGKAVLMFFWAHWCPDCKAEGPIIARLLDKYRSKGLVVIAPTQRYGYINDGSTASPDQELRHIIDVRDKYYGFLRDEAVPLSDANHKQYGVSSTPTLALIDRTGIVRLYHPGLMAEAELEAALQDIL